MPRPKKAPSKSPFNQRQRELADKQHQIQVQIEALQRSIEEAPRRAAAEAQGEREQIVARSRERGLGRGIGGLSDKRHVGVRSGGRPRPVLKAERHAERLKTLALLVGLVVVVVWLVMYFF